MSDGNKKILQEIKKALTPKRVIVGVFIALVLLIPSVLAIANVSYTNSHAIAMTRASEVVLLDSDGTELYHEVSEDAEFGETSLIGIFNSIYNNITFIERLPVNTDISHPLTALITTANDHVTLTCFFSFSENASYCVDDEGISYKMLPEDSERFLASVFAEPLYKNAEFGTLKSDDGDIILPSTVVWNYKNAEGSYSLAQKIPLQTQPSSYSMTGEISFDFSVPPTFCNVIVMNGTEIVFDGTPTQLGNILVDSNTPLNVTVSAIWSFSEGCQAYGSAIYSFEATIRNRSEFSISSDTLPQGGFAVVSATNVTSLSKLKFASENTDFIPRFTLVDTTAYAVIPFSAIRHGEQSVSFTLSYGVSSRQFTISTTPSDLTRASLLDCAIAFGFNISNSYNSEIRDSFLDCKITPPPSPFTKAVGYGELITYNDLSFSSCFTEYSCTGGFGENVSSFGSGKVVDVGHSNILGGYAVIDMGLGVRLWYANLSFVDVRVGEYVCANDIIGKTGTLSHSGTEGFSALLCYNDTALNIDLLFDK